MEGEDIKADVSIISNKVKELEGQLGVTILEEDTNVSTLKDQFRETKNTFKNKQEEAEEFINKIAQNKKLLEGKMNRIRKKELEKYKEIENRYVAFTASAIRTMFILNVV